MTMAKLILSVDGTVLREISLSKERTTLGRKPHNDIQVNNLAVSGEHAAIVSILNEAFIEDLNSTNGTLVNGKPIKKHFLQNNDVVEIGKYKLKYFSEAPVQSPVADFERTMIIRKPFAAAPISVVSAPAAPAAPPPLPSVKEAAIRVLSGAVAGRTLDLTKSLMTIGKPGVQVAVITRRSNGFFIAHVEGALFPSINGVAIDGQAEQLNDHDLIEIASVKMEFYFKA
jgi:hypothetical protein